MIGCVPAGWRDACFIGALHPADRGFGVRGRAVEYFVPSIGVVLAFIVPLDDDVGEDILGVLQLLVPCQKENFDRAMVNGGLLESSTDIFIHK